MLRFGQFVVGEIVNNVILWWLLSRDLIRDATLWERCSEICINIDVFKGFVQKVL